MKKERLTDTFAQIVERVPFSSTGDLKKEMQKIWGEVNKQIFVYGNYDIGSIDSRSFTGVFPMVVQKGRVILAEKIGTRHESTFFDEKIILSETPVSGFLWRFRKELAEKVGSIGIFEPDDEIVWPGFPLTQISVDRSALKSFLHKHNIFQINKAEYQT